MEKNERRIDLFSLLLGFFISMIAQGIYDLIFYYYKGEVSDFVFTLTLIIALVSISLISAVAWSIFREIKKANSRIPKTQ